MRTHGAARMGMFVLGALMILVMMIPALGTSAPAGSNAVQYRTLVLPFPPPPTLLQTKLDEFGQEGWELVAVISQGGILIFKR